MKNFRFLTDNKLLMRSESLYRLKRKDRKFLFQENGIKVVIDLRTNQESQDKKDYIPKGVKYFHLPLISMEEMGASSEKEGKRLVIKEHKLPDIYNYYQRLVYPKRKENWSKIFDILLNEGGPILLHCTVGKDRSGITSAMILYALGKTMDEIYEDYLKTNEHIIIPFSYRLFALSLDKDFRKEFMEYFRAKKEYIDSAFAYISQEYGGLDGFLKQICLLDDEKINKLKKKYL